MRLSVSTGTAKPTPALVPVGLKMAEVMPITRPLLSRSGPPELPGLMAASVWMMPVIVRSSGPWRVRSSALMPTVVSVRPKGPKGLPIAIAHWPTRRSPEAPRVTGCNCSGGSAT